MNFAIITHTPHKQNKDSYYAYEPYVREINLWTKNVKSVKILAPIASTKIREIDAKYIGESISIESIPQFNIITFKSVIMSLFKMPIIIFKIIKVCIWADHIHIRCPGNIGLLGCFIQVFFPSKPKTVKYAGNWDPESKQPLSYRLQKWILSNTFLTKNCKVLVYGQWKNQTKNIKPFFTATYSREEIEKVQVKDFNKKIIFIYVGAFSKGKQPLKSVKVIEQLNKKGYNVELNMFGNGDEYNSVKKYIEFKKLNSIIYLKGNCTKAEIKRNFQKSHFLVFISKSEGWPKVIAEAMFWGCLPISTKVSCIPTMLDNGNRGAIVGENIDQIVMTIKSYIANPKKYQETIEKAVKWSQNITIESFANAIKEVL